jgi:hypothetical protein
MWLLGTTVCLKVINMALVHFSSQQLCGVAIWPLKFASAFCRWTPCWSAKQSCSEARQPKKKKMQCSARNKQKTQIFYFNDLISVNESNEMHFSFLLVEVSCVRCA